MPDMCYSRVSILTLEDFEKLMYQKTRQFIKEVKHMECQNTDSSDLEDISNLAFQYKDDINEHLLNAVDPNRQSQDQALARHSSPRMLLEPQIKIKSERSSYVSQLTFDSTLEMALSIWDFMLKEVKSLWQQLLNWLKKIFTTLKDAAISLWEGVIQAMNNIVEWFEDLF